MVSDEVIILEKGNKDNKLFGQGYESKLIA